MEYLNSKQSFIHIHQRITLHFDANEIHSENKCSDSDTIDSKRSTPIKE